MRRDGPNGPGCTGRMNSTGYSRSPLECQRTNAYCPPDTCFGAGRGGGEGGPQLVFHIRDIQMTRTTFAIRTSDLMPTSRRMATTARMCMIVTIEPVGVSKSEKLPQNLPQNLPQGCAARAEVSKRMS